MNSIGSGSISYNSIKSKHIIDNKNAFYEKDKNRRRMLIEQATLAMDETDSDSYNNYEEKNTFIPFSSENLNNI